MEKKKLIIGLLAFVIFIAGASVLYSRLSKDFTPDAIVEDSTQGEVDGGSADKTPNDDNSSAQTQPAPDFTMEDMDGNALEEPRKPEMQFKLQLPQQVPDFTILRKAVDLSAK